MERTAVVINEFGEIGLDHLLVKSVTDNAIVLQNGCICCTIRSDVRSSFAELIDGRASGAIPGFDRIVLETTGLADPVPIVQTLVGDPMLRHQVAAVEHRRHRRRPARQRPARHAPGIAAAGGHRRPARPHQIRHRARGRFRARLRERLHALNPTARLFDLNREEIRVADLIVNDAFHPLSKGDEVRSWLAAISEAAEPAGHDHAGHGHSRHDDAIKTFVFRTERPIDWTAFGVWLSALVHRHGKEILRIKGLLNVPDAYGPVVLNAVQRIIHQPTHLESWPDDDRSTRIVFIVQGLDPARLKRSLDVFLRAAEPSAENAPAPPPRAMIG